MTEYNHFRQQILRAGSYDELQHIIRDVMHADLTSEDKDMLKQYARARYGNHIQFVEG